MPSHTQIINASSLLGSELYRVAASGSRTYSTFGALLQDELVVTTPYQDSGSALSVASCSINVTSFCTHIDHHSPLVQGAVTLAGFYGTACDHAILLPDMDEDKESVWTVASPPTPVVQWARSVLRMLGAGAFSASLGFWASEPLESGPDLQVSWGLALAFLKPEAVDSLIELFATGELENVLQALDLLNMISHGVLAGPMVDGLRSLIDGLVRQGVPSEHENRPVATLAALFGGAMCCTLLPYASNDLKIAFVSPSSDMVQPSPCVTLSVIWNQLVDALSGLIRMLNNQVKAFSRRRRSEGKRRGFPRYLPSGVVTTQTHDSTVSTALYLEMARRALSTTGEVFGHDNTVTPEIPIAIESDDER